MTTGVLRSLRTSSCFGHGPNSGQGFAGRTPSPLSALGRRKLPELGLTWIAINVPLGLGADPKTTAPFANFQVYAQFHDGLSLSCLSPNESSGQRLNRGVKKTGRGTQDSCVLMGDCRPRSLVDCHARSAQIREDLHWPTRSASEFRIWEGNHAQAHRVVSSPVHSGSKRGQKFLPLSLPSEGFRERFPQVNA